MVGSTLAVIIIPIVVAIALFGWITAVLYADTHSDVKKRSTLPRYEVTGGAFEAREGGRQLMPIPGERPMSGGTGFATAANIPAPRSEAGASASASEASASEDRPTVGDPETAEKPHLVAGSKLRLAVVGQP